MNKSSHCVSEKPHKPQDQENDCDNVKDVHLVFLIYKFSVVCIQSSVEIKGGNFLMQKSKILT